MPRLLIVDDTPLNLAVAVAMLRKEYDCITAASGAEALAILERGTQRPDLALLDVMMPGMDGFSLCAALKGNPSWSSIPVIFLTAFGDPEGESRARAVGGVDYLSKPIGKDLLHSRLQRHLITPNPTPPAGQETAP